MMLTIWQHSLMDTKSVALLMPIGEIKERVTLPLRLGCHLNPARRAIGYFVLHGSRTSGRRRQGSQHVDVHQGGPRPAGVLHPRIGVTHIKVSLTSCNARYKVDFDYWLYGACQNGVVVC